MSKDNERNLCSVPPGPAQRRVTSDLPLQKPHAWSIPKLLLLGQSCQILLDVKATKLPPTLSGSQPSLSSPVLNIAKWHPFLLQ